MARPLQDSRCTSKQSKLLTGRHTMLDAIPRAPRIYAIKMLIFSLICRSSTVRESRQRSLIQRNQSMFKWLLEVDPYTTTICLKNSEVVKKYLAQLRTIVSQELLTLHLCRKSIKSGTREFIWETRVMSRIKTIGKILLSQIQLRRQSS